MSGKKAFVIGFVAMSALMLASCMCLITVAVVAGG